MLVEIELHEVTTKADSEASCLIISEETFQLINDGQITVEKMFTNPLTWSRETLSTEGKTTINAMLKVHVPSVPIMVVAKQGRRLMGQNLFPHLSAKLHGMRHTSPSAEGLTVLSSQVSPQQSAGVQESSN